MWPFVTQDDVIDLTKPNFRSIRWRFLDLEADSDLETYISVISTKRAFEQGTIQKIDKNSNFDEFGPKRKMQIYGFF